MSSRLSDIAFGSLLPESIRDDAQLAVAAEAIDGLLRRTTAAIPNLLIWARLDKAHKDYLPPLARLIEAAGGLKPLSPELLELLAWQLHVDFREAAVTPAQLESMIRDSIPWHRIKGTPASIKAALALFGLTAEIEEDGEGDYWATYQIGLPQIADLAAVQLVCRVATEMQPARCSLYRITTDVWDMRPGAYSGGFDNGKQSKGGGFYSEAAYSYYSGVPVEGMPGGGEVIVSFGRLHSAQTGEPLLGNLCVGRERLRGVNVLFADDLQYSAARYSESILPPNHGFVRSRLNSMVIGLPVYLSREWTGPWDERRWCDVASIGRDREPFSFARTSVAVIEGVYSESVYSDLNGHYSQPVYTLVDDPPAYSDAAYSDHDPQRRTLMVDEMLYREHAAAADEPLLTRDALVAAGHYGLRAHQTLFPPFMPSPSAWDGPWDTRRWMNGRAFTHFTHEEITA